MSTWAQSDFGGVQAAVDPDDRLALGGQLGGLGLADALGQGQAAGDALVVGQLRVVGRRGDDAHELRPAFLGVADVDDLEPVGLAFQLVPSSP